MENVQESAVRAQARTTLGSLSAKLFDLAGKDSGGAIADFVSCFNSPPPYAGYKYIPFAARQILGRVEDEIGHLAARDFLFACIQQAVLNTLASSSFANLPIRVRGHQLKQFNRITSLTAPVDGFEIDSDLFHKDFGLANMHLYAAAAQLVDHRAGIGRRILLNSGVMDIPRRVAIFAKIGGFRPFFEIHTHLSYLVEFNEEGWNECYRCCADLYALHPKVLGMQGISWFYDPALESISPRLNYLRDIPAAGRAHLLFDSIDQQSTQDAVSTSPTRKKLYDEGKYQPKKFTLIWPRAEQISWSKDHQK